MRMNLLLASLLAVAGTALTAKIPGHGLAGQPCYGDDNCYSGNRCVPSTKKCVASYKGVGDGCTYDEECKASSCQNGICTVVPGGFGSTCTGTNQCPEGKACTLDDYFATHKICTNKTPGQAWTDCHGDGHCTNGHVCVTSPEGQKFCNKGQCTARGLACTSSKDCCRDHTCSIKGQQLPIPVCQLESS